MDDDGGLGMRHWGYFEQPALKGNLGLQLMPSVVDRDTKPLLSNGGFLHRDCAVPQPSMPIDFVRDSGWIHHGRDNNGNSKILHILQANHNHQPNYNVLPEPPAGHTLQMLQLPEPPPKNEKVPVIEEAVAHEAPLKKRSQGRPQKSPKPKKPKKVAVPRDESSNALVPRGRTAHKSTGVIINGISFDISGIPTPICTCTGKPQQCYRWGVGGWQSACCTISISMYPLPMSTKRRGARISGRKMSQGAFTKVLEKLAGEGYNLSNPIDLKTYWAKHGTNKFVIIR